MEWLDKKQTVPTEKEVTDKIAELDAAEAMRLLRVERNARLQALDWEVVKAYSSGVAVDEKLKTYMQALRDLPASAKPKVDAGTERASVLRFVFYPPHALLVFPKIA